jgi:hypothetical protein
MLKDLLSKLILSNTVVASEPKSSLLNDSCLHSALKSHSQRSVGHCTTKASALLKRKASKLDEMLVVGQGVINQQRVQIRLLKVWFLGLQRCIKGRQTLEATKRRPVSDAYPIHDNT